MRILGLTISGLLLVQSAWANQSNCANIQAQTNTASLKAYYHRDTLNIYKELAEDAKRDSRISYALFSASSLVLTASPLLGGMAYGSLSARIFESALLPLEKFANLFTYSSRAVGDMAASIAVVGAVGIAASPTIISVGNGVYRLIGNGKKYGEIKIDLTENDLDKVLSDSDRLLRMIALEKANVDLDYSVLEDMITLGAKDAKTMAKLYELARVEQEVLDTKAIILKKKLSQCKE